MTVNSTGFISKSASLIVGSAVLLLALAAASSASSGVRDAKKSGVDSQPEVARLMYELFLEIKTQADYLDVLDRLVKLKLPQRVVATDELARLMQSESPTIRLRAADAMRHMLSETSDHREILVNHGGEIDNVPHRDARVLIDSTMEYKIYMPREELDKVRTKLRAWWSERRKKYLEAGK